MVGVGKLKQLNGCAVFDDERNAHAVGWLFGATRISRPINSDARSLTSNATCGTCLTNSGTGASVSNRIHSTPYSLFSCPTTKVFRWSMWRYPRLDWLVGIPMW